MESDEDSADAIDVARSPFESEKLFLSLAYMICGEFLSSLLLSRRKSEADESKKLVPREVPRIAQIN